LKTLIIYASKTGTTEKCAKEINRQLKDSKIVNILNQNEDINKYDLIVIGTPIRMGMIDKKIKKFLINNIENLKSKKVAYFICCGFNENWKSYYEQNIPKDLLDTAIIYDTFGGEMDIQKQKGFDKFITKMVSKNIDKNKEIKILNENIDRFIKVLNSEKLQYIGLIIS
jgi:menaquinone-dependent protoporphyrinogen oxidase